MNDRLCGKLKGGGREILLYTVKQNFSLEGTELWTGAQDQSNSETEQVCVLQSKDTEQI